MLIKDIMTPDVLTITPDATLRDAARIMAEADVGALPVADEERLLGMITDRDIAVRGVAAGNDGDTRVEAVMTRDVLYCYADAAVEEVCRNLGAVQVRRLPVVDRDKRLVGIVSLADLAVDGHDAAAGAALAGIAKPGGAHSQTLH